MNAEVQWWLLILGIVIGGALVYLVMADLRTAEDRDWSGEPLGDEDEYDDDDDDGDDDDDELPSDVDPVTDDPGPPARQDDLIDRRSEP